MTENRFLKIPAFIFKYEIDQTDDLSNLTQEEINVRREIGDLPDEQEEQYTESTIIKYKWIDRNYLNKTSISVEEYYDDKAEEIVGNKSVLIYGDMDYTKIIIVALSPEDLITKLEAEL